MRKEFYLSFLVLVSTVSQGIGDPAEENREENIEKSSPDVLVRKKRVSDYGPERNKHSEMEKAVVHTAGIERDEKHVGAGVIVLAYLILTASPCAPDNENHQRYTVRTGSTNVMKGDKHNVTKIHIIDKHKEGDAAGILALLFIIPDIDFVRSVCRPILLPTEQLPYGSEVIISGWGREVRYPERDRLYNLQLGAATVQECVCCFGHSGEYICTKDPSGQNYVRLGPADVGGPVFANGQLFGIHLRAGNPAVHIKVSFYKYRKWIDEWIQKSRINPYRPYVGTHENIQPNQPVSTYTPPIAHNMQWSSDTGTSGTSGTFNQYMPHPHNPHDPHNMHWSSNAETTGTSEAFNQYLSHQDNPPYLHNMHWSSNAGTSGTSGTFNRYLPHLDNPPYPHNENTESALLQPLLRRRRPNSDKHGNG